MSNGIKPEMYLQEKSDRKTNRRLALLILSTADNTAWHAAWSGKNKTWYRAYNDPNDHAKGSPEVTIDRVIQHLEGRRPDDPIGLYYVDPNGNARKFTFDVDQHHEHQDAEESLRRVEKVLEELRVAYTIMRSRGGKGFHVTVYLETPQPAFVVRRVAAGILAAAGVEAEVFPKQDVNSGTGFQTPPPYARYFVDETGGTVLLFPRSHEPILDLEEAADVLEDLRRLDAAELYRLGVELGLGNPFENKPKSDAPSANPVGTVASGAIEDYLRANGIGYTAKPGSGIWTDKYLLDRCRWSDEHTKADEKGRAIPHAEEGAAVFFDSRSGKMGFWCFHDSCAKRGWTAFRKATDRVGFRFARPVVARPLSPTSSPTTEPAAASPAVSPAPPRTIDPDLRMSGALVGPADVLGWIVDAAFRTGKTLDLKPAQKRLMAASELFSESECDGPSHLLTCQTEHQHHATRGVCCGLTELCPWENEREAANCGTFALTEWRDRTDKDEPRYKEVAYHFLPAEKTGDFDVIAAQADRALRKFNRYYRKNKPMAYLTPYGVHFFSPPQFLPYCKLFIPEMTLIPIAEAALIATRSVRSIREWFYAEIRARRNAEWIFFSKWLLQAPKRVRGGRHVGKFHLPWFDRKKASALAAERRGVDGDHCAEPVEVKEQNGIVIGEAPCGGRYSAVLIGVEGNIIARNPERPFRRSEILDLLREDRQRRRKASAPATDPP